MTDPKKPATPAEAEELAKKAVGDYLTACRLAGPDPEAMGNYLMKLASVTGVMMVNAPGLRDDMCKSCACQPGSVPNGCLQTQLDLLKSAAEGQPFLCHAPKDGRICAGWAGVRAQLAVTPLPAAVAALLAKHRYSAPDVEETKP